MNKQINLSEAHELLDQDNSRAQSEHNDKTDITGLVGQALNLI